MLDNISLELENGETLTAPIGVWLAGVLASLPDTQRTLIQERVSKMVQHAKGTRIKTPKNHILSAEPLHLNFKGTGDKNGRI